MKVLLVLLSLCFFTACSSTAPTTRQAFVSHVVITWLKDPGNSGQRKAIIKVSRQFETIPGVLSVRVGESLMSDRAIVDDSFDVAIIITFADEASLEAYLVHPQHKKAVKEVLKPLVKKIQVYDIFDEGED